ncbi:hypothetical protein Pa4123_56970, partial [Phytohabitans aurantiacus]
PATAYIPYIRYFRCTGANFVRLLQIVTMISYGSHWLYGVESVMADTRRPMWRKSSRCDKDTCVEVALAQPMVAVRDGKDPAGPMLIFRAEEWRAFVRALRDHEL